MKNKNIDINKIKVVIFDFDDTLAIHKDKDFFKHRSESEEKFLSFYKNAYLNSDSFYEKIEPCIKSELLYKLINILRSNSVKMYCLSGMKFSFHLKAKQSFINKNYGNDIEVISCQSQEQKVDGVKIIQQITNCNLNEILFIDDMEENIINLNNLGVYALLADNVETLLNDLQCSVL